MQSLRRFLGKRSDPGDRGAKVEKKFTNPDDCESIEPIDALVDW
jgi:hypothetical protein